MDFRAVECPDKNCQVRMVWVTAPLEEREAAHPPDRRIVCLDADDDCTGHVCILFSIATVRMRERLRRLADPGNQA